MQRTSRCIARRWAIPISRGMVARGDVVTCNAPAYAAEIVGAGADVLVAGSAIFRGPATIFENVDAFRKALDGS